MFIIIYYIHAHDAGYQRCIIVFRLSCHVTRVVIQSFGQLKRVFISYELK